MSDAALIRRTAAGDPSAFDALVQRHLPAVLRYVRALAREGVETEEVLCETFLAARRTASRWQDDTPPRAWLLTLAHHALHRRYPAGPAVDTTPLDELRRAAGWGRADGAVPTGRPALERAFAALAPADRALLVLRDLEGLSGQEAAAITGTTEATARTRLHRARLRLLAHLRETGNG